MRYKPFYMEARTIITQYVKEMRKKYKLTQVDLSEKAEVGLRFVNEYQLTPAYDLLSMALVIPEDTEELALTLCGKKRKLPRQHFVEAMIASGLDEKMCNNIFARLGRLLPEWEACIRQSFLPQEMQEKYINLISERLGRLNYM